MEAYKHSFKVRQACVGLTESEIRQVLALKSYLDVMNLIDEIKKRKVRSTALDKCHGSEVMTY